MCALIMVSRSQWTGGSLELGSKHYPTRGICSSLNLPSPQLGVQTQTSLSKLRSTEKDLTFKMLARWKGRKREDANHVLLTIAPRGLCRESGCLASTAGAPCVCLTTNSRPQLQC